MLNNNEKLLFQINILEFENKRFIKVLKIKKKKKNKGKKLNLLGEKNNSP